MKPGAIAFTKISSAAKSHAVDRVRFTNASLAA